MLGVVVILGSMILIFKPFPLSKASQSAAPVTAPVENTKPETLNGRWVRTDSDGAYILTIQGAAAGGKLEAGYFNPNPIHVGQATWRHHNNRILLVVELQDENYPGSTYTLQYDPGQDQLTGTYYQAIEGMNFEVAFTRE